MPHSTPFRSPSSSRRRSRSNPFALFAGLSLLFGATATANATVTIEAVNAGSTEGNTSYFAGTLTSTMTAPDSAFMDEETGAIFLDLSRTRDTIDDRADDQVMLFDVRSDADFTVNSGQMVVLTVRANPASGTASIQVPIIAVGKSPADNKSMPELCDASSLCHEYAGNNANHFLSVEYAERTTYRVGILPRDICIGATDLTAVQALGCTGDAVTLQANTPTTFVLSFGFSVVNAPGGVPTKAEIDSAAPTEKIDHSVRIQGEASAFECPSEETLESIYFPGDREITLNTDPFDLIEPSNNHAPRHRLIVVLNKAAPPILTEDFADNSVADRLNFIGDNRVTGLDNAESETDNLYQMSFLIRDRAGIIVPASNPASGVSVSDGCGDIDGDGDFDTCCINGVQASAVRGFLKESSCFIATAAYQSGTALPVKLLRAFRDQVLLRSQPGEAFVHWYYAWSPRAADWLMDHPGFRYPILVLLLPVEAVAFIALALVKFPFIFAIVGVALLLSAFRRRFREGLKGESQ